MKLRTTLLERGELVNIGLATTKVRVADLLDRMSLGELLFRALMIGNGGTAAT